MNSFSAGCKLLKARQTVLQHTDIFKPVNLIGKFIRYGSLFPGLPA